MKKYLSFALALVIVVSVLAGCGGSNNSDGSDSSSDSAEVLTADSLKTIGDVEALENKTEPQREVGNGRVVCAFKYGDTYYRVRADMPEDVMQAYFGIDIMEDGFEEKQNEIVAPLEINKFEILSDQILTQDELDALKGKTGQELVDEGWTYEGSFFLDDMEFWMSYGPFVYKVEFDGSADGKDADNYDAETGTKELKVKSAEFSSLGMNATSID